MCPANKEQALSNESKCPVPHGMQAAPPPAPPPETLIPPRPCTAPSRTTPARSLKNFEWWPEQLKLNVLRQNSSLADPMGGRVQLRGRVQVPRPRRRHQGPARRHDRLAGVVARRLRPLRPVLHPHGLALRHRHLSCRRRPRRRRLRHAALRPAQQLAGQRLARQGPPPHLAHQAEVWPEDFMG